MCRYIERRAEFCCEISNVPLAGCREKKVEGCQMTQEVDLKSAATGLMEGILPRARTSTILEQCGIILDGTKGSQYVKKSFGKFGTFLPHVL